jgi:hypothetical protein
MILIYHKKRFKITTIVAWYDMWIGAFFDIKKKALYILPIPCLGVVIRFLN